MNSTYTIAITGGTGFIGGAIVTECLRRGHALSLLVRTENQHTAQLSSQGARIVQGDCQM